jgi:outer membrane protein OmpA-like peptidoglycan-associated protein
MPGLDRARWNACWLALLAVGSCVAVPAANPPVVPASPAPQANGSTPPAASSPPQDGAADADAARLAHFRQLATQSGAAPPEVKGAPGAQVIDLVFDSRVLFDTDSDVPRAEAAPVLDALATAIRTEAPGLAITVLGHTDSVGSDAYNIDLSRRRAQTVIADLVAHGVRPDQLSAVAIGKRQPIASNATDAGRARNRRVEFLISPSLAANLSAVAMLPATIPQAQVLRPTGSGALLVPSEELVLKPLPPAPALRTPAPAPSYQLNTPQQYRTNPLGPAQTY